MKLRIFLIAFIILFQSKSYASGFDFADDVKPITFAKINQTEADSASEAISKHDPYSPFNRKMFAFNMAFHDTVGRPLNNAYRQIPSPARTGLENFLDNLTEPFSMLNSFLQGDIEGGFTGLMRFTFNSTFGFLGLLDVASEMGLHSKNEDFGQTLFVWGLWPKTNYLVLPLLGPTTTRGLAGDAVESVTDPVQLYERADLTDAQRFAIFTTSGFVSYTKVAPLLDDLMTDPNAYEFAREAYIQLRMGQLYNGLPPMPSLDQFNID